MKGIHVLVAEDDPHIRLGLVDILESEGFQVTAVADGQEARDRAMKGPFDLIVLDIMMPGMSGYDVCRAVRAKDTHTPIILLTAKGEEMDKVVGLQLGADDYVTKPFGVHEFLARIAAVLRRSSRGTPRQGPGREDMPAVFVFGCAEVDARQYRLKRGEITVDLSSREVKLLRIFARHPGEVLSRDELLNQAWGIEYYGTTRTLDQHIAQLRKKVEQDPGRPVHITTVHGVGYRYTP